LAKSAAYGSGPLIDLDIIGPQRYGFFASWPNLFGKKVLDKVLAEAKFGCNFASSLPLRSFAATSNKIHTH